MEIARGSLGSHAPPERAAARLRRKRLRQALILSLTSWPQYPLRWLFLGNMLTNFSPTFPEIYSDYLA